MKDDEGLGPLPAPTAPVAVFWDLENCHVPTSVEAAELVGHIFTALRQRGLSGVIHIQAYADTSILPVEVNSGLSSTGVNLLHVARGRKEASDKAILVDMVLWALDHPPPAHFLLISGDRDFSNVLHRLKLRNYNIMLATTQHAKPSLMNAASLVWEWAGLARGQQLDPVPKSKRQAAFGTPLTAAPALSTPSVYSQPPLLNSYNHLPSLPGFGPPPPAAAYNTPPTQNPAPRPHAPPPNVQPAGENGPPYSQGHLQTWSQEQAGTLRQGGPGWQAQAARASPSGWGPEQQKPPPLSPEGSWEGVRESSSQGEGRSVSPAVKDKLSQILKEHPAGCVIGDIMQALRLSGFRINWVGMGFSHLLQLLKALPEVCTVREDVQTKEGYKITRIFPARQVSVSSLMSPDGTGSSNQNYGSSQGSFNAEPRPQSNGAISPGGVVNRPPLVSRPGVRPPAAPFAQPGGSSFQSSANVPGHAADPRGAAPVRYQAAQPSGSFADQFNTLVDVVWELQRQAGGHPPDQKQVIAMLRNEHGELFASYGGYGPYETPFKYIEAAQKAGYLDLRKEPPPGSFSVALTSRAGEHAYDFLQSAPVSTTRPPPLKPAPASNSFTPPKQAKPASPDPYPHTSPEPRIVVSADPPEAEELDAVLTPMLLRGASISLKRDQLAPTEANIRARVVQLMRPQSVMVGGTEIKQWYVRDPVWEDAIKAAVDAGELVRSTAANREILLPLGTPSWRFVDPHFTGLTYSAAQWSALEDTLRQPRGRAAVEGSYTRYAAARALQQAGSPVLKEVSLGQVINLLQLAAKKGWLHPGANWRPARVVLTPLAESPQQTQAPPAPPHGSKAGPIPSKAFVAKAVSATPGPSASPPAERPQWLVKLRAWLPPFLQNVGPGGCRLASLKVTFKQVSGINITEDDVRKVGYAKFSLLIADITDVCTLQSVMYHDKNKDYVVHPTGWTPPPKPSTAADGPSQESAQQRISPALPVSTFFPKEVGSSSDKNGGVTLERAKKDMAALLADILPQYPEGLNAGSLKVLFAQRFQYQLNHEALGFSKLREFLQALPADCCRITATPHVMVHLPASSTKPMPAQQAERKQWSPVKKSSYAVRPISKEELETQTQPRQDTGHEMEAEGSMLVGTVRRLTLSSEADMGPPELDVTDPSVASIGAYYCSILDGDELVCRAESSLSPPPEHVDVASLECTEDETMRSSAGDVVETAHEKFAAEGVQQEVEKPFVASLDPVQPSTSSPVLIEVAADTLIHPLLGGPVEATPQPALLSTWSPDSLATPAAHTPDRPLVLPLETTAYAVKPAELRSRLAREVHASQDELDTTAAGESNGKMTPDGSPVSQGSTSVLESASPEAGMQRDGASELSSRGDTLEPMSKTSTEASSLLDSADFVHVNPVYEGEEGSDVDSGSSVARVVSPLHGSEADQ